MKKFIFITVQKIKDGTLKFRFLPGQSTSSKTLNPSLNIKVMNGKSLDGYEPGAIYSMSAESRITDSTSHYSVRRYSLISITKELSMDEDKIPGWKKDRVSAYKAYKESMKDRLSLDPSEKADKPGDPVEEKEPTFLDDLKANFTKVKPSISKDGFYVKDSDWMILIRNIKQHVNTLITGPTGSGKTTAIKLACEKLGIPCSVYDMGSMFDPISSLLGVHRLEGGSSIFDYAKFAQDVQKPGVILLDELSRAPIQSNNILFPCLDDRRTLPVEIAGCKDLRTISIHPEVCFIATANIGIEYTGTNAMDRALMNRFFPLELDYLDKSQESSVLQQRCGITKEESDLIVRVATEIRNIYKKQELSISVSTRETLMVAELVHDGWGLKEALSMVLLPLFEGTNDPREESTERGKIRKLLMTY